METTATKDAYILTVNAGSSSVKLAVFAANKTDQKIHEASIEGIGLPSTNFISPAGVKPVAAITHLDAAKLLAGWVAEQIDMASVVAVGHRIVHGGPNYHKTMDTTDDVLADLRKVIAFDPGHLPVELDLIAAFQNSLPHARQVLCFDTAFHYDLPTRSRLLPLPRRFGAKGLRRYGFHGLSYAFILEELRRTEGEAVANGRVVIAHLGNGASLAAIHGGKSIDTTMSLTPASGIPMSTRSGDLDPGLALYLAKTEGYDAEHFNHLVNFESGLLGVFETTADMKTLLETEAADDRAKDAVDIFCYNVKKNVGGFAAALGGLDTLVFTGGMGENAPKVRARVCEGLSFLGITIDPTRNQEGARRISAEGGKVGVHVIHTDEAITIARETALLIST